MAKQQVRKAETQKSLLSAASRSFRSKGYAGVGVDGIARAAGATSGAFYSHLGSKDGAFLAALELGLDEVIETVPDYQRRYNSNWPEAFARYYLGSTHRRDLACGCAMTALSPDVVRSNDETRELYEHKMKTIAELIAKGLEGESDDEKLNKAWAFLSILIGALTTSRAMSSDDQADAVASAAFTSAMTVVGHD
ncbi:TetR/AcrR family transcriptional regulator [Roseibium album]|uniref:TetR/AcrR family transcriptional regulator n=1 Tax=Roseibium album TaxID=311410 RepID=UPI0018CAAAAF|nr:TetR/AcrR family transcriptional regulator [Roseibium album]MBG6203158.1 AcrR family transcriptional regulator [Labrenzia sp. EL_13]